MLIDITISSKGERRDITLDSERIISECFAELKEIGIDYGTPTYVRSMLQKRVLKTDQNFDAAGIRSGDLLKVLHQG